MKTTPRKGPGRKGYRAEVKAKILAAAKKENLTGAQVSKRFGIAILTFYKWRGPVKGANAKRRPGRPKGSGIKTTTAEQMRRIIWEEVARALRG